MGDWILSIKVIPKSHKNTIVGWEGNALKVKIAEVPKKGKVNQELIRWLAKIWDLRQDQLELISGQTSRLKKLRISGIDEDRKQELELRIGQ